MHPPVTGVDTIQSRVRRLTSDVSRATCHVPRSPSDTCAVTGGGVMEPDQPDVTGGWRRPGAEWVAEHEEPQLCHITRAAADDSKAWDWPRRPVFAPGSFVCVWRGIILAVAGRASVGGPPSFGAGASLVPLPGSRSIIVSGRCWACYYRPTAGTCRLALARPSPADSSPTFPFFPADPVPSPPLPA